MYVMTRAFYRSEFGRFFSRQSEHEMELNWISDLVIPSTAAILWFKLLNKPTEHTIPVTIRDRIGEVDIETAEPFDYTVIYRDEFRAGDFQKLQNSGEKTRMYLQVLYRD